eukprot:9823369-Alexandrium_andersonii.AAC.1
MSLPSSPPPRTTGPSRLHPAISSPDISRMAKVDQTRLLEARPAATHVAADGAVLFDGDGAAPSI